MCRCNVTTSYSSAREDIERKLQVFPEDVVVRCHLIRTPIDALELLLVTRRVDYAGAFLQNLCDRSPSSPRSTLPWAADWHHDLASRNAPKEKEKTKT